MKGQTVVVTGANRGLGLELCRQLAAAGAEVIGTARQLQTALDLRALEVRVEVLDVSSAASVGEFAQRLAETAVDVLNNNAGKGGSGSGVADLDLAETEEFFVVNTLGPLRVTQALLPNLRRGRERKVIQITSRMGSLADNREGGYYGYRASKAALNMINRTLALELGGQGFVCALLHPGWVWTRMGGMQAPLSPADSVRGMLRVVRHLTRSDNGAFLDYTGQPLPW